MYTISLDIGGTFTDGFFTSDAGFVYSKVPTTPQDLTVCLMASLEHGARQFGISLKELLAGTSIIRLSSTLATNILVQGTGARVGLLVTEGYEQCLYGAASPSPAVGTVVRPEMIVGIREEVSESGDVVVPVSPEAVLRSVRNLIENRARIIAVALQHSPFNPVHERQARETIYGRYPEHYLRSVPVQISTDVSDVLDDYTRTNSLLLNAYFHLALANVLYKLEDRAKESGLRRPLLVVHSTGGVARISKTTALQTLASGPTAGLTAAALVCRDYYPARQAVAMDIGGTSTDFGIISDGVCPLVLRSEVNGLCYSMPAVRVDSVGLGGGSIATISANQVVVGPRSTGAYPGPASFGQGGTEPTLTDANLLLGYLDPRSFLGGKKMLYKDKGETAIEAGLAQALGCSAVEAAARVRAAANSQAAQELRALTAGMQRAADTVLLAYGGGGPLHGCDIAEKAGLHTVVTFPIASVFSAFGVSTMDVMHVYVVSFQSTLYDARRRVYLKDTATLDALVSRMRQRALVDMRGEGFSESNIRFQLDLVLECDGREAWVRLASPDMKNEAAVREACQAFRHQADSGIEGHTSIYSKSLVLRSCVVIPHWAFPAHKTNGPEAHSALSGQRNVYWPQLGHWQSTPIYDMAKLCPGNRLAGPAIIETNEMTCALPLGWALKVDQYLNLEMTLR